MELIPKKLHAGDMELIISRYFGQRQYSMVPNVSWGLGFRHEIDLLVVRKSGYAIEVEIKVSISDLRADLKKGHGHRSCKLKQLYFALPEYLMPKALEYIPEGAGIIIVRWHERWKRWRAEIAKSAPTNKNARKLTDDEISKLGRLAIYRLWTLKEHNYRLQRDMKDLRNLHSNAVD